MATRINVLYGFKSEVIEKSINKEITIRGYNVKSVMRTSKDLIKDYLKKHPEIDAVVLKEYLDGGGMYSPIELTELVDDVRNVNVVIVLATSHRGKPEMREIYSAGILNAFFSDGKFGANPDKLAQLVTQGRTRREAREYYKINEIVPDHINLTYEGFRENYKYLVDNRLGVNIIDRFVTISTMLYPGQMGKFIDDLPESVKGVLMKYREFYDIANRIYKLGYARQKYKMPKGVKAGLTPENMQEALAKDIAGGSKKPKEVEFKAVENKPVKRKMQYEEYYDKEEEDTTETVSEDINSFDDVKDDAPAKKGLFGKGKKKGSKKGEESLLEQVSDVDFSDIKAEPVAEDAGWGSDGEKDASLEAKVPDPTPAEDVLSYHEDDAVEAGDEPADDGNNISENELDEPEPTQAKTDDVEDVDYSSLTPEQLMELLGK